MPCLRLRAPNRIAMAAALATLLLAACTARETTAPREPAPAPATADRARSAPADDPAPKNLLGRLEKPPVPAPKRKPTAKPAEPVDWPLQSAFGSRLRFVGEQGARFVELLAARSDGAISLKFFEPGAHVPSTRIGEAVGDGRIPAGYTSPAYLVAREPALAIFAGTPFGPSAADHYAWLREGGGLALQDALYARLNLKGVPCLIGGAGGFGWFREPVEGADDMQGLKIRASGLSGKVLDAMGASSMIVAGADIYPGLERGALDAVSFAMPYIDVEMGFDQIADTFYYPGPLQPFSVYDLVVNRDRWQALAPRQRQLIEDVCDDNVRHGLDEDMALTAEALETIRGRGVTVAPVPPAIAAAARAAWARVAAREAAADPDFARIYKAYRRYLATRPSGDPLG